MTRKKDLSVINCIATSLLVYFITVPGHELLHLLTDLIYGDKITYYSAGAVDALKPNLNSMPLFHRIMDAGGSASILNALFGIILLIILLKCTMGPMLRLFLTQLMGAQFVQGIGYFMIGGLFSVGDWNNVFEAIPEYPGLVTALRIILSVVGCVGIVALFFILNHMSYYFIEDAENKKERLSVAFKLHLIIFIIGFAVGTVISFMSPAVKSGYLSIGICMFFNMMWIPFFWGFMFTGVMKVLPPKKSRFLYHLPAKPNWFLFVTGIVLILIDIFIFGPGIKF